jgi:predicted metalloprotease
MRWRDLRRSSNIDDLRRRRGGVGRGGFPFRIGGRGGVIATIAILVIVYFVGGPEALNLLVGGGSSAPSGEQRTNGLEIEDEAGQFAAAILGSTEDEWQRLFAESGRSYSPPRLTLFADSVQSACGFASSAVGPFYCPADRRVYLDTSFFADLARMGGPGDFAQAYVIGHEIGHHVQNLLGTAAQIRSEQQGSGETAANRLQVAMELQADCYAGVWAHHANLRNRVLEPGDVEEGLAAAAAIGDDRLQANAGRRVAPDSFTHGSSEQRRRWLETGLSGGDPGACDTF